MGDNRAVQNTILYAHSNAVETLLYSRQVRHSKTLLIERRDQPAVRPLRGSETMPGHKTVARQQDNQELLPEENMLPEGHQAMSRH